MANTAYGTCMYLEFRKGPITAQRIIVPEHAKLSQKANGVAGVTVMYREQDISKGQTRQEWNFFELPVDGTREIDSNDQIVPDVDIVDALDRAGDTYRHLDDFIVGLFDRGFSLYGGPLYVEIGPAEVRDLDNEETPDGLLRRIDRVRVDAGFPAKLWKEEYIKK
jgi:hypothetical protein